jgi:hypothetical protein
LKPSLQACKLARTNANRLATRAVQKVHRQTKKNARINASFITGSGLYVAEESLEDRTVVTDISGLSSVRMLYLQSILIKE